MEKPDAESFYLAHPLALIAKRMMKDIIQLVKTKKTIRCIPKRPESICYCDKSKLGWPCTCTPGRAPCTCGPLVVVEEELASEVVEKLTLEIQQGFWLVYRFDSETLRTASEVWSDDDLATLWGAALDGQRVWRLRARPRREVSEDWRQFCVVETIPKLLFR